MKYSHQQSLKFTDEEGLGCWLEFIIVLVMPGQKKWCEYCRINLPFDKKAIQEHEATLRHTQNQKKAIKFQRIKIQQEQKASREASQQNAFISSANIPKAKKGSQLEKEVAEFRDNVIANGKMAIHQLIASKTHGQFGAPIQYPEKQDLVIAQNYQDSDAESEGSAHYEMWKIDICEETGKPCFVNRITKAVVYEPPKGYVMSEEQKQEWEETIKICEDMPVPNMDEAGQVGQWEQVPEEEDYFLQNRAQDSEEEEESSQHAGAEIDDDARQKALQYIRGRVKDENGVKIEGQQIKKQRGEKGWLEELQERVDNNEVEQDQVVRTMLSKTLDECHNVKERNETLKKLIRNDFQIRATLARGDQELGLEEEAGGDPKKQIGFKPRKKIKKCQLTDHRDLV